MLFKCDLRKKSVCHTCHIYTTHMFLHKENAPMGPAPRSRNRTAPAPEAPSCPSQSPCTQGWPLSWLLLAWIRFCGFVFLEYVWSRCCAIPSAAFLAHHLCVGAPGCSVTPGLCLLTVVQDSRWSLLHLRFQLPMNDTVAHILCPFIPHAPCEESPRRDPQGWTTYLDFICLLWAPDF